MGLSLGFAGRRALGFFPVGGVSVSVSVSRTTGGF